MLNHAASNIEDLPIGKPLSNSVTQNIETINKIKLLRDQFLAGISELQELHNTKAKDSRSAKALLLFNSRSSSKKSKDNQQTDPIKVDEANPVLEEDVIKAAHVLAQNEINQDRVRRISIRAPLKDIIGKLRDNGFYHPTSERPMSNNNLATLSDAQIIAAYSAIMYGLLN